MAAPATPPPPWNPPPGGAPVPGPYFPPPMYPPPPPKSKNLVMVVVLFVVITVVVTVVLAAVLFVLFAGLLGPPTDVPPVVHFGPVTYENQTAVLNVFSVSRAEAFTLYEANLFVNSTVGVPQQVSPSFQLSVGNESFTVDFVDAVRPGTLDPGDSFRIAALTGWRTGVEYQFELLWTNESPVAFVRWTR